MADTFALRSVEVHARNLEQPQAQSSLAEQAADCAYIVQALGYYDLADHLKHLGANTPRFRVDMTRVDL